MNPLDCYSYSLLRAVVAEGTKILLCLTRRTQSTDLQSDLDAVAYSLFLSVNTPEISSLDPLHEAFPFCVFIQNQIHQRRANKHFWYCTNQTGSITSPVPEGVWPQARLCSVLVWCVSICSIWKRQSTLHYQTNFKHTYPLIDHQGIRWEWKGAQLWHFLALKVKTLKGPRPSIWEE